MNIKQIEKRIITIVQQEGRRPRILLAPLESGQTGRWTNPLAASLAEFGFDVDIGPLSQAPLQVARLAIDNDVHIVCVSVADINNQPLVIQLAEALQAEGGADIRLVVGSTCLQQNHDELYGAGVDLIINLNKANINLIDRMLKLFDESGKRLKP
jgi:methylmalonyl-CoA mutase